jgi:phage shock protein A
MKRKKRLEKGIKSLEKQVEIHKQKLKQAVEQGNEELAGYYEKDIKRLENELKKKKGMI